MLPPDVLRWVAQAVGPGARVEAARPLSGATSSVLHALVVTTPGGRLDLVLRRYLNEQWLADEPDVARHEAANLEKVRAAALPTPELIACDADGRHCGAPAILMTRLPGRVALRPSDRTRWLYGLAAALPPLHAVDATDYPWRYAPYNDVTTLTPPAWSRYPALWQRTLEIVNGPPPPTRSCFIHRDYHPVNVLWHNGRVSGIVDWPNACGGPAGIDVAWCRANLAGMAGLAAADAFLRAYEDVAGATAAYHPFWDLMVIIEILPGPPDVYPPWVTLGLTGLTAQLMRERHDAYLRSVMARL